MTRPATEQEAATLRAAGWISDDAFWTRAGLDLAVNTKEALASVAAECDRERRAAWVAFAADLMRTREGSTDYMAREADAMLAEYDRRFGADSLAAKVARVMALAEKWEAAETDEARAAASTLRAALRGAL